LAPSEEHINLQLITKILHLMPDLSKIFRFGIFLSRYPEVQREIFGRDTKGEKGG